MAYLILNNKGEHEVVNSLDGYEDALVLQEDVDETLEHVDIVDDQIVVNEIRMAEDAITGETSSVTPEDLLERLKLLELRVSMLESL